MSPHSLVPTSFAQAKRLALWHGPDNCWKAPLAYALAYAGRFDQPRLESTLRLLARRHNALRTYFLPEASIDAAACLPPEEAVWPLKVVVADDADDTGGTRVDEAYDWLQRDFAPFERPLVRALLLRRPDHDVLGLAIDHILLDGFSAEVLFDDLAHVYEGLGRGGPGAFDVPVSDAVGFARAERAWLASGEGEAALAYWDGRYRGLEAYPRLDLPEHGPYQPAAPQTYHTVRFDAVDVRRLRRRRSELRVSTFMLVATAVTGVVGEHTTDRDSAFLFADSRRSWPLTRGLVAYAANRSVLRVPVHGDEPAGSLARRIRAATVDAVRHHMLCHEQYLRLRFPDAYQRRPTVPYLMLNMVEPKPLPTIDGLSWDPVPLPSRPGGYTVPGVGVNMVLHSDGTATLRTFHPDGMYEPRLMQHVTQAIMRYCLEG
jgi:hypothetical protein